MNDIETLEDIIESLATLRIYQRKDGDIIGAKVTTELIKKIRDYLNN